MKTLLICGDSYMALAGDKTSELNHIHWSQHLDKNYKIVNLAQPGASNIMILDQLTSFLKKGSRPDAIVLGFTALYRLEVYDKRALGKTPHKYITICNDSWFNADQKEFRKLFLTEYPIELRALQECSLIEYTILLSKSIAPTVYTLGLFGSNNKKNHQPQSQLLDLYQQELPLSLINGIHWSPNDPEQVSFHVKDPVYHRRFAEQINSWLLTI